MQLTLAKYHKVTDSLELLAGWQRRLSFRRLNAEKSAA